MGKGLSPPRLQALGAIQNIFGDIKLGRVLESIAKKSLRLVHLIARIFLTLLPPKQAAAEDITYVYIHNSIDVSLSQRYKGPNVARVTLSMLYSLSLGCTLSSEYGAKEEHVHSTVLYYVATSVIWEAKQDKKLVKSQYTPSFNPAPRYKRGR